MSAPVTKSPIVPHVPSPGTLAGRFGESPRDLLRVHQVISPLKYPLPPSFQCRFINLNIGWTPLTTALHVQRIYEKQMQRNLVIRNVCKRVHFETVGNAYADRDMYVRESLFSLSVHFSNGQFWMHGMRQLTPFASVRISFESF